MTEPATQDVIQQAVPLTTVYEGWGRFQRDLVQAVAPLTPEQLALPVSSNHWPIGILVQHIMNDRIWWFHQWLGEGSAQTAALMDWDDEETIRPAAELVAGLEATWGMIEDALAHWTVADLAQVIEQPASLTDREREIFGTPTRQWIIWHSLRHDMHHGGELAVGLGSRGLPSIWG